MQEELLLNQGRPLSDINNLTSHLKAGVFHELRACLKFESVRAFIQLLKFLADP